MRDDGRKYDDEKRLAYSQLVAAVARPALELVTSPRGASPPAWAGGPWNPRRGCGIPLFSPAGGLFAGFAADFRAETSCRLDSRLSFCSWARISPMSVRTAK